MMRMGISCCYLFLFVFFGPHVYKTCDTYAASRLRCLVQNFSLLYGSSNTVYSLHAVIHLPEHALAHRALDGFSRFP